MKLQTVVVSLIVFMFFLLCSATSGSASLIDNLDERLPMKKLALCGKSMAGLEDK